MHRLLISRVSVQAPRLGQQGFVNTWKIFDQHITHTADAYVEGCTRAPDGPTWLQMEMTSSHCRVGMVVSAVSVLVCLSTQCS